MAAPGLQEPAKKALATLDREWDGLIAHRDYPMIGLDNNTAERAIRGPVVARKNAGGSRNEDAARLAATFWTVTATAQMAGLNVLTYLTAYLDACGRNGGKHPAGPGLDRFLPWKASPGTRVRRRTGPGSPPGSSAVPQADFRVSWLRSPRSRRLPEFFQEIQDAFTQAGKEDSVFPIRHFYQRWGAAIAIERRPLGRRAGVHRRTADCAPSSEAS